MPKVLLIEYVNDVTFYKSYVILILLPGLTFKTPARNLLRKETVPGFFRLLKIKSMNYENRKS